MGNKTVKARQYPWGVVQGKNYLSIMWVEGWGISISQANCDQLFFLYFGYTAKNLLHWNKLYNINIGITAVYFLVNNAKTDYPSLSC